MEISRVIVVTLSVLVILVTSSSVNTIIDFCVADLNQPLGPAGFPCRNPANLIMDDFVFSGLGVPADMSDNIFKVGVTAAVDGTFPVLNGLGLSMARLDIDVGGVVPIHTPSFRAYFETLKKGDIMIFPQGLLHFQVNVGDSPSLAFVSLNSAFPVVEKITLLEAQQVKKLKQAFGGTN
ncbi:hypothetical protein RND81_06G181100 [Saponaria officinalis]|uniref:Cupin type-1 domain-containing protein n=1 Tax=Saponaria officinalis TaxID=3572 RepID=A0AAW1KEH4_SAPOF